MALFDSLIDYAARLAESGLVLTGSALKSVQSCIGMVAGQDRQAFASDPPLNGPKTLDGATSDALNQMIRIAVSTPMSASALIDSLVKAARAAKGSFSGLDLKTPAEWASLSLQLPLSLGTLAAQQALRALYLSSILGPWKAAGFARYMAESFNDFEVFVTLHYGEVLNRMRADVRQNPDDAAARLRLGRLFTKLGLFKDAAAELELAALNPSLRAEALAEAAVARFRSGDLPQALHDGVASLGLNPGDDRARFWVWLSAQRLGGYPPETPPEVRMEVRAGRHQSTVEFEDVARECGLDKTSAGRGTAVFDMDGDGYLDVVVASAHGGINVYHNNGDGTFTDVTIGSGLEECVNGFCVAVGDYNNDGMDDLFVTRLGFYAGDSVLYRNNGDGTFTDVTCEAGVSTWGPGFSAQWVDYDRDGNLDLFIPNNIGGLFDRKTPNRLFHNNGDGSFTEMSRSAGLNSLAPSICGAWGDYDNDGYPDLFISSGVGRSQLFHNNGDGTFTEVSRSAGIDGISFGSVSFWCDYDNDGWLDLVQYVWSPEEHVLYTLKNGDGPAHGHPMRIYHNNRNGTFTKRDRDLGFTGCWGTMSGAAGDFNNDGYVDFFLGNGDPHMNRTEPPVLLEFDENCGRYKDVGLSAGLPFYGKTHGANMADLNGDGRLCLILAAGGAYPGDLMSMSVFRPKTLPGNYLNVRLVGTRSNRNAIGARLRLDAGGRSVHLLVSGGTGFGCHPYEQHFGLGRCRRADALHILWPNGLNQCLQNLPVNSTIRVVEGEMGWEKVYGQRRMERREQLALV